MTENTAGNRVENAKAEAHELVKTPFGESVVTNLVVPSHVADKRYVSVGGGGGIADKVK
ncbi:hypothetical protein [Pseudomonas amygdali]|uniref:hypothetical protein n=1 Tax=Pseudomonas amygdali TaxID=47877 RepID=UPI001604D812|nr:hypothetical protein [Pseudomonas amygdali]